jgi:hypothetical protein
MATFSYDPTTPPGLTRLKVGDTIEHGGPRPHPDNSNFSDEEIEVFLEQAEGSPTLAAALICDVLANEWGAVPRTKLGPHEEDPRYMVQNYQRQALALRGQARASVGFSVVTGPRSVS